MKSRIVQPAASFQPLETCTEHAECQAGQASNADLCRAAQAHYEMVSGAVHEWYSSIPKAIAQYYETDTKHERLRAAVVEAAKEWHRDPSSDPRRALHAEVRNLIAFEAEHKIGVEK